MSLQILIVDDEPPARARLRALIHDAELGEVVGEAGDGVQALGLIADLRPQLVLLDIRMPVMDGLEAARHLSATDEAPAVVFTTAYQEHALAAFDAGAIDYLLKPIRAARLAEAVGRARRLRADALPVSDRARTHLSATLNGALRLVPVAEVRVARAEHKYVTVVFPGGQLVLEESLSALEEEFSDHFLRVHRNALVAAQHVAGLERLDSGATAVLMDGVTEPVEVSRRLIGAVRRRLRGLQT